MKKYTLGLLLIGSITSIQLFAQDANLIINKAETERIEKFLSSDELE